MEGPIARHGERTIERVPAAVLRRLSRLNPFISSGHILLEWCSIVGAIWVCARSWHPLLYVATVMWIGARQHALVVMMHEGAHYLLFRSKRWNDIVGEFLLGWPVFIGMRSYRRLHIEHHQYTNSERDPDWVRNQPDDLKTRKGWRGFLFIVLGMNWKRDAILSMAAKRVNTSTSSQDRLFAIASLVCYGTAISVLAWCHLWRGFILFWLVPIVVWLLPIMRMRGLAEHFAVENANVYSLTRTTLPTVFERLFIAPKNVNYHLEHHLYPSVPFYRLPQLHQLLLDQAGYRATAHLTQSYWGVLRECLAASSATRVAAGGT